MTLKNGFIFTSDIISKIGCFSCSSYSVNNLNLVYPTLINFDKK